MQGFMCLACENLRSFLICTLICLRSVICIYLYFVMLFSFLFISSFFKHVRIFKQEKYVKNFEKVEIKKAGSSTQE